MVCHEEVDATVAKCFVGLAGIEAVAAEEIEVAAAVLADVRIEVADRTERS